MWPQRAPQSYGDVERPHGTDDRGYGREQGRGRGRGRGISANSGGYGCDNLGDRDQDRNSRDYNSDRGHDRAEGSHPYASYNAGPASESRGGGFGDGREYTSAYDPVSNSSEYRSSRDTACADDGSQFSSRLAEPRFESQFPSAHAPHFADRGNLPPKPQSPRDCDYRAATNPPDFRGSTYRHEIHYGGRDLPPGPRENSGYNYSRADALAGTHGAGFSGSAGAPARPDGYGAYRGGPTNNYRVAFAAQRNEHASRDGGGWYTGYDRHRGPHSDQAPYGDKSSGYGNDRGWRPAGIEKQNSGDAYNRGWGGRGRGGFGQNGRTPYSQPPARHSPYNRSSMPPHGASRGKQEPRFGGHSRLGGIFVSESCHEDPWDRLLRVLPSGASFDAVLQELTRSNLCQTENAENHLFMISHTPDNENPDELVIHD